MGRKRNGSDMTSPAASIVVPSYNRPDRLKRCLEALLGQQGVDFEIVVVDDGSDVPLEPVCAALDAGIRCIRQDNAGPASARNRGAEAARGAFLAFTDDDCCPGADWLTQLMKAHGGSRDRIVGGRVENGLPANPYASTSQMLCDFLYDYFGARDGTMPFFTSNNMGCDRQRFLELQGFDETFPLAAAEDREFGMRWRAEGGELVYAPDAVIRHYHGMSFRGFWRQHQGYGRGARHLHDVLQAQRMERPRFESIRFYAGLLFHPARRMGLRGVPMAVLMGLTQVAMVSGYVQESLFRRPDRGRPRKAQATAAMPCSPGRRP